VVKRSETTGTVMPNGASRQGRRNSLQAHFSWSSSAPAGARSGNLIVPVVAASPPPPANFHRASGAKMHKYYLECYSIYSIRNPQSAIIRISA
jgi:hypothetical protein